MNSPIQPTSDCSSDFGSDFFLSTMNHSTQMTSFEEGGFPSLARNHSWTPWIHDSDLLRPLHQHLSTVVTIQATLSTALTSTAGGFALSLVVIQASANASAKAQGMRGCFR